MSKALTKIDAFNSHSNSYRCDKGALGAMPAPQIKRKDEAAYTIAMRKNEQNRKAKKCKLPNPFA